MDAVNRRISMKMMVCNLSITSSVYSPNRPDRSTLQTPQTRNSTSWLHLCLSTWKLAKQSGCIVCLTPNGILACLFKVEMDKYSHDLREENITLNWAYTVLHTIILTFVIKDFKFEPLQYRLLDERTSLICKCTTTLRTLSLLSTLSVSLRRLDLHSMPRRYASRRILESIFWTVRLVSSYHVVECLL